MKSYSPDFPFLQYQGRIWRFSSHISIEQENMVGTPERAFIIIRDPFTTSKQQSSTDGVVLAIDFASRVYSSVLLAYKNDSPDNPELLLQNLARKFKYQGGVLSQQVDKKEKKKWKLKKQ